MFHVPTFSLLMLKKKHTQNPEDGILYVLE